MQQFKNFEIYNDLYEKPFQHDWAARLVFPMQILLFSGALCNRFFWEIRLKIYMLPNFTMLFQPVVTKFSKANWFHVYRKLITWSTTAKCLLLHKNCSMTLPLKGWINFQHTQTVFIFALWSMYFFILSLKSKNTMGWTQRMAVNILFMCNLFCKWIRLQNILYFVYSITPEETNRRSGARLKTESKTGERR